MNPIEVRGLHKSYGDVKAVEDVSFAVAEATIFGLIGPDGGGKTTIMRSIVSLLSFDSGEVIFQGKPVDRNVDVVRASIGYMPQRFSLYQDLTVEENLRFFGDLFNVPQEQLPDRIEELYRFSTLGPFRNRRAGALSGGMKQKLALSCMLVHEPSVIVLDEPTFGVDPVSRNDFWEILKTLSGRGTTVLVSTAYMDEALLCDRVALVYRGRILAEDEPETLKRQYGEDLYLAATDLPHLAFQALEGSGLCGECRLFGEGVHFTLAPGVTVERVAGVLDGGRQAESAPAGENGPDRTAPSDGPDGGRGGGLHVEIRRIEPGLEDLFLKLMKE